VDFVIKEQLQGRNDTNEITETAQGSQTHFLLKYEMTF
jgi:hypothetical protein